MATVDRAGTQPVVHRNDAVDAFVLERTRVFERCAARWPGALTDPFDLLEAREMDRAEVEAIEVATASVSAVYRRVLPILHSLADDALLAMGLRPETLALARLTIPALQVPMLARVDLARTSEGYKLLEYNAEAPGLLVETFAINAVACADSGLRDVNASGRDLLAEAVHSAVRAGLEYVGGHADEVVVAFSYRITSARDRAAARYLTELVADISDIHAVEVHTESLRVARDGLFLPDGRRLAMLWQSCPIHYLGASLCSPDTTPNHRAALIADLVRERKLALVNAPDASLLASKAAQAVIWGLVREGLFFTTSEADSVRRFFLPTFLDPPDTGESYVVKPAFGSEGDSIEIVDLARLTVRKSPGSSFRGEPCVYQTYVELPAVRLMTETGARDLQIVTSCFLLAGRAAGIILRAGDEITDDQAWVVPVGLAPSS